MKGPDTPTGGTMRRRVNHIVFWIIVLSSMAIMILLIIRPDLAPQWSGVSQTTLPGENVQPAKTLWDWLALLVLPTFLVGAVWWLGTVLRSIGRDMTAQRIEAEHDIAAHRRHQITLEAYYDSMTELLKDGALRDAGKDATVRHVAQARTLAVLRSLDGKRRGEVLRFLYDSGLIGHRRVIELKDADMRGAQLSGANLNKACLWLAQLNRADLTRANLKAADLWLADLAGANLRGANLRGAHLGGANLHGADLRGADLTNANLRKANLDRANLYRAAVTVQQLSRAGSVEHITLPDGTVYENGERLGASG